MVIIVKPCHNVQLTWLRFLLRDSEGKNRSELEYDHLKVKVYTYNSLERFYSRTVSHHAQTRSAGRWKKCLFGRKLVCLLSKKGSTPSRHSGLIIKYRLNIKYK